MPNRRTLKDVLVDIEQRLNRARERRRVAELEFNEASVKLNGAIAAVDALEAVWYSVKPVPRVRKTNQPEGPRGSWESTSTTTDA